MSIDSTDNKILRIFLEVLKSLLSEKDMDKAGLIRVSGVGKSIVTHAYNAKRMPIEEDIIQHTQNITIGNVSLKINGCGVTSRIFKA